MLSPSRLRQRSEFLQTARTFFFRRDYIEVDTPIRLPTLIPEANIIPFSSAGWFLQTSPEICMKRLLAAGSSRIFQICRCFRKEEQGRYHLSEFTMLEWYRSGWDYQELMNECEELVCFLAGTDEAKKTEGEITLRREGRNIALSRPWPRLTVAQVFLQYTGMSAEKALEKDVFDQLLVEKIEPYLGWEQPVFLLDYPTELASLARCKEADPSVAERFELYIGGIEIANGFSELTDVDEQRFRFRREREAVQKQRKETVRLPEKFLDDLHKMPESAGIALGLDRLFMIFTGGQSIAESVVFTPDEL